jgi:predicted anti-sigma-YlaC factor YlaD
MVIQVDPDPFERRQVARWLLGAFEVALVTILVSTIFAWLGTMLAIWVSRAIGNDPIGSAVAGIVWGAVFGLIGAYAALRYLAR